MSHLPPLLSDLALILITAGVVTIIFKLLKQPVVLGYIVAGFLISPHFGLFPNVAEIDNINIWAEIGIIFLLFALGLEFSFKKLMDVGGAASIATLINMGSMIAIGYILGQFMGWSNMESVFLGGMLSMSSTTIIIKAFTDMGLQKQKFANIVFAMLIVEDLAAIVMMVLLSTVAVSQNVEGMELVESVLKLVFFMLIWFVIGIYLIPSMLKRFKKYFSDETLLVVSIGLCLGMVLFASSVGFSAALGAFIMGSILAETVESKRIEHLVEPLKNFFGAVFFVSVGMMIVPNVVIEYSVPIIILTLVVLVGRIIFATLGVLASGEGLKVSVQAGFSLAQIGEFSFIIATLGMQLGVLSNFIYPIIVAVSVITTFTTPYCIKGSGAVYKFLEKRIPAKWEKLIDGYALSNHKTVNRQNDWNVFLKKVLVSVSIYFSLALAVLFLCREFLMSVVITIAPEPWGAIGLALVTIVLMAPFMVAIMRRNSHSEEAQRLWKDNHFNKGALIALNILRFVLCITLIMMVLIPLFPQMTGLLLVIAATLAIGLAFSGGFKNQSQKMEARFFENLNDKENAEDRKKAINKQARKELLNKNIHLEEIEVPQNSRKVGKTLSELNFRQSTGVDVISIIRGRQKINIPGGDVQIFPFDRLIVAGTDEELTKFIETIGNKYKEDTAEDYVVHQVGLAQYELEEKSPLVGKSIKTSNITRQTDCMIIGIERNGEDLLSFSADTILQENDILWLAGEKNKLSEFGNSVVSDSGSVA